jgi:uncharacterized membrane protein YccC
MERNAMEIVFKFVLAIATLPTALGGQLPPTLAQSPGLFGHGAPIALCLGCIVSLAGMLRRDRVKGMAVQLVGLSMVAAGATFYALALGLFAPDFAQARVAVGMFPATPPRRTTSSSPRSSSRTSGLPTRRGRLGSG